jgi:hypothetical protein
MLKLRVDLDNLIYEFVFKLIPKVLFRPCIVRVFGLSVPMKATMQVMQVNHIFEARQLTDHQLTIH